MGLLADGDRAAFDPLFRALYPRAVRLARARLDDAHAADASQATMLKLFARASEFESGAPVLPWFYAIAANEVHAIARRCRAARARSADEGAAAAVRAPADDPERLLLERELCASLDHAIAALDAPAAAALRAILGRESRPAIEAPAFRKRVSRAYARLRTLLGGAYGD